MPFVHAQIIRIVDEYQPGFVEAVFQDSDGVDHRIIDKVPIFTNLSLSELALPRRGAFRCEVLEHFADPSGRRLVRITIARPDDLQSLAGAFEFTVEDGAVSNVIDQ